MARQMKRKAEENAEAGPSKKAKTENDKAEEIECPDCHQFLINEPNNIRRHLESAIHLTAIGLDPRSGRLRVRCPSCKKEYSRSDAFIRHIRHRDRNGNPLAESTTHECEWVRRYKVTQDEKYLTYWPAAISADWELGESGEPDEQADGSDGSDSDSEDSNSESGGSNSEPEPEPTFSPDDTTLTSGPCDCFICWCAAVSYSPPSPIAPPLPEVSAEKIAEIESEFLDFDAGDES